MELSGGNWLNQVDNSQNPGVIDNRVEYLMKLKY